MMKIILSRKGFDSENGGQASPIMPDGTLLSLPIPSRTNQNKFTELFYKDKSYFQIIHELSASSKIKETYNCHLDPDIRTDICLREYGWRGLFGQVSKAQGHLRNQGVSLNDLFLFFGWFRQTEVVNERLRYVKGAPDLHIIYGYLQIGRIYTRYDDLPTYAKKHPHTFMFDKTNNCIYEAADTLSLISNKAGYGCLKYKKDLVLTKEGYLRSCWNLPDIFKNVSISYHDKNSFKESHFESAKKGQEFVIDASSEIISYCQNLLQE